MILFRKELTVCLFLNLRIKMSLKKIYRLLAEQVNWYLIFFGIADMSFGEFVSKHSEHKIGIMNVCQAPLQKTDAIKHRHYYDYNILSSVRTYHKAIKKS